MSKIDQDLSTIQTCVSLLSQHKKIHTLSLAITLLATACIFYLIVCEAVLSFDISILILILILGMAEILYSVRISFDCALWNRVLDRAPHLDFALDTMDQSLFSIGLIKKNKMNRDLASRITGCTRLFKRQLGTVVLQVFVLFILVLLKAVNY